ncbi:MAG: polyprenyl synthetase family protein [Armatimonadota bacterium]
MKNLLNRVDKKIRSIVSTDEKPVAGYFADCVYKNGKRIRAQMLILSNRLFKNKSGKAIDLAAVIEVIHFASLLHDDVVDNGSTRRGKTSLNALWGNKVSILLADYLLARAMKILCREEYAGILKIIIKTIEDMSRGQLYEITFENDIKLTVDDCIKIINSKTASLFAASCRIGAVLAGTSSKDVLALESFGRNFGILFQIVDDILDYWGNSKKLGKSVFNDLARKNLTLPLILLLKEVNCSEKEKITKILKMKNIPGSKGREILKLMNKYRVKENIFGTALTYYGRALNSLDRKNINNKAKEDLINIAKSVLEKISN